MGYELLDNSYSSHANWMSIHKGQVHIYICNDEPHLFSNHTRYICFAVLVVRPQRQFGRCYGESKASRAHMTFSTVKLKRGP